MKRACYFIIITQVLLITYSCEDDNLHSRVKVIGTGPVVSESLDLPSFNRIENTGVADFEIISGGEQSVVIKAQQNIIDVMNWNVNNGSLTIGVDKYVSIEKDADIIFEITVPEITDISLTGVGDFHLSGAAQDILNINVTGVGNINAYGMNVKTCNINLTGVGDCRVSVIDNLDVIITGVGSVYYKGNPDISSVITGVGKLIDDN